MPPQGVDDVGNVTVALVEAGLQQRFSKPTRYPGRVRSGRAACAPTAYVRIGPTPRVSTSQPRSVSIGDPQLPICTTSQDALGRSHEVRLPQTATVE